MGKVKIGKFYVDEAELDRQHREAVKRGEEAMKTRPRAVSVRYDKTQKRVIVNLSNDTTFIFPPHLAQELSGASDAELADVRLLGVGFALEWTTLDAHFSVENLLAGIFGNKKLMENLIDHLAEIGRICGRSTSEAKRRTSAENGKKGGRPKLKKAI